MQSPREILADIWNSVGGDPAALNVVTLTGEEPQLPSSFRVAAAAQVSIAASGLAGTVRTRVFQGNHWLYQVETASGLVTVIQQNTGAAMPAEGEAVHLKWGSA